MSFHAKIREAISVRSHMIPISSSDLSTRENRTAFTVTTRQPSPPSRHRRRHRRALRSATPILGRPVATDIVIDACPCPSPWSAFIHGSDSARLPRELLLGQTTLVSLAICSYTGHDKSRVSHATKIVKKPLYELIIQPCIWL